MKVESSNLRSLQLDLEQSAIVRLKSGKLMPGRKKLHDKGRLTEGPARPRPKWSEEKKSNVVHPELNLVKLSLVVYGPTSLCKIEFTEN